MLILPAKAAEATDMWAAVIDDKLTAAEPTSHSLALKLHDMKHRRRQRVLVQYGLIGDIYIVGVA